ncbi:hypothetical protein [Sphingomonas changbaiensis]|nr:hypothetical protein [Sphingomonas changbaiensis]
MPVYRLYCLDRDKHITARADIEADTDAAAIQYARDNHPGDDCEIWELGRRVAVIARDTGSSAVALA